MAVFVQLRYSKIIMDIDRILRILNAHQVDFILIGGVNFLLNHVPVLTFDTDIWFRNSSKNRDCLNRALQEMGAEWGETENTFRSVPEDPNWLKRQVLFCLNTRFGALDIMAEVKGLEGRYHECREATTEKQTPAGIAHLSLSDKHMLDCQLALEEKDRKLDRIRILRAAIARRGRP